MVKRAIPEIPKPSKSEVDSWLKVWDADEAYVAREKALVKLFQHDYPRNDSIDEILIKAAVLNDFYNTNIFNIYAVSKHIFNLKIDKKLEEKNPDVINEIMKVEIGGKERNFYSFATKYCSFHVSDGYPIYDRYVKNVLIHFKKESKFCKFKTSDLKDYKVFLNVISEFQKYYGLTDYSVKEIDQYLWQIGKKYYPDKQ